MTEKRYIRNIVGQIYDIEKDKFYDEDYTSKPIDYEDDVVKLLNKQDQTIKEFKEDSNQYKLIVESLKNENQKLKLKLKDLGVEYY